KAERLFRGREGREGALSVIGEVILRLNPASSGLRWPYLSKAVTLRSLQSTQGRVGQIEHLFSRILAHLVFTFTSLLMTAPTSSRSIVNIARDGALIKLETGHCRVIKPLSILRNPVNHE